MIIVCKRKDKIPAFFREQVAALVVIVFYRSALCPDKSVASIVGRVEFLMVPETPPAGKRSCRRSVSFTSSLIRLNRATSVLVVSRL